MYDKTHLCQSFCILNVCSLFSLPWGRSIGQCRPPTLDRCREDLWPGTLPENFRIYLVRVCNHLFSKKTSVDSKSTLQCAVHCREDLSPVTLPDHFFNNFFPLPSSYILGHGIILVIMKINLKSSKSNFAPSHKQCSCCEAWKNLSLRDWMQVVNLIVEIIAEWLRIDKDQIENRSNRVWISWGTIAWKIKGIKPLMIDWKVQDWTFSDSPEKPLQSWRVWMAIAEGKLYKERIYILIYIYFRSF